jgi:pimeloyl-ACP methyl ester carboxylesterase
MMLQRNFFVHYRQSRLHYAKGGHGPRPLLLFHGFGQSHEVFDGWADRLGAHYTVYAFDLYFHGASRWPSRSPLGKNDWVQIMQTFLAQEHIDRFEVGGFSMGGKFALATAEHFAPRIDRLLLLAPDGIKTSYWYNLATYPLATRALFKSMIMKPHRLHRLVRALHPLGVVDKGVLRFAERQMNTEEKRRRVYFSWVYYRRLKFDLAHIAKKLNGHNVPLLMITGRYDKIITTSNMARFVQRVRLGRLIEIEAGHNDLIAGACALPELIDHAPSPAVHVESGRG